MSVKKIVAMLSSDNDGEVLNAVRVLSTRLKAAGKDFHWLGERIDSALGIAAAPSPGPARENPYETAQRRAAEPKPQPKPARFSTDTIDTTLEEYRDLVGELMDANHRGWRQSELNFVEDINYRFERFGLKIDLSARQRDYISDLHNRYIMRGRR